MDKYSSRTRPGERVAIFGLRDTISNQAPISVSWSPLPAGTPFSFGSYEGVDFTASATVTINGGPRDIEYMILAGGGAGGGVSGGVGTGGGGAGGLKIATLPSVGPGSYSVSVGGGGAPSSFSTASSTAGGGAGTPGGSGGGGPSAFLFLPNPTLVGNPGGLTVGGRQGHPGGLGGPGFSIPGPPSFPFQVGAGYAGGGGGGGRGEPGWGGGWDGGNGGSGITINFSGTPITLGGGGGGLRGGGIGGFGPEGIYFDRYGLDGSGGAGGGGPGPSAGLPNTGGGGGGAGLGGSGRVMIRWARN